MYTLRCERSTLCTPGGMRGIPIIHPGMRGMPFIHPWVREMYPVVYGRVYPVVYGSREVYPGIYHLGYERCTRVYTTQDM